MFRRSKSEPVIDAESAAKAAGKGRPTPTRREAEAAARQRAKVPRTRKEQNARARSVKSDSSQKVRAGMKAGEERYLLPRDKGPVRRFIRDFVDSRFSVAEVAIPLMIITLIPGIQSLIVIIIPLLAIDLFILRTRVRKQITQRFPDAPLKGTSYYTITRAMQMKFMRLPKPKVKLGQDLPEHYR